MLRYETLILTVPEITSAETENLEKQLNKILKAHKASLLFFDKWGKIRLAYPVRKNEYGVYFLLRYEVEDNANIIKDLDTLFKVKLSDLVMRYLSTELDLKKSLDYKRPPSVDQLPAKGVDEFIKENKMEGFLQSTTSDKEEDVVEKEDIEIEDEIIDKEE